MSGVRPLGEVLRRADTCDGIVTRDGEQDACGKPPVALMADDGEGGGPWPACAWHANRYGPSVTLVEVVEALDGAQDTQGRDVSDDRGEVAHGSTRAATDAGYGL